MMPKKNGGVAPGSGKTQCSNVGQYQNREVGGVRLGEQGEGKGLMGLLGSGEPEKGKSFEM